MIVGSTVQEKALADPTDSKLLEPARFKVLVAAKANCIELNQTDAKEGHLLGYKAGRYAHEVLQLVACAFADPLNNAAYSDMDEIMHDAWRWQSMNPDGYC